MPLPGQVALPEPEALAGTNVLAASPEPRAVAGRGRRVAVPVPQVLEKWSHTSITENAIHRTFDVQYIERHDADLFDVLFTEMKKLTLITEITQHRIDFKFGCKI